MTTHSRAVALVVAGLVFGPRLRAQSATPAACRDVVCAIVLDWGPGKTSASYPPDRRHGSGDDFEQRFAAALRERGYRITADPSGAALTLTVRPVMRSRVACDRVTGLNPDLTCTAMSDVALNFAAADAAMKAPAAIRVINRCGATDTYMTHRAFAEYAAATLWWELEGRAARADRPRAIC